MAPQLVTGGTKSPRVIEIVEPGTFESAEHFYPRVLNAQIHPLVRSFLSLGNGRVAKRYCHLHPEADPQAVNQALGHRTRYFSWGGADLFSTTTDRGQKRLVVVETNSCPSGQKSMPIANEDLEQSGYRVLLERSFMPTLRANTFNGQDLPEGALAVLYDKNKMEASGYAAVLADLAGERVFLTPCYADDPEPKMRFRADGVLEVHAACAVTKSAVGDHSPPRTSSGSGDMNGGGARDPYGGVAAVCPAPPLEEALKDQPWVPIRAAVRYVTQRPWTRIPPISRTYIFNPVLACLAGGRNKSTAAKAYDLHNAEIAHTGLTIYTPETIWDVAKPEVPLWVARMGGLAVVKVPYANAGQGVWTITREEELKEFMGIEHRYDRFIVQALIGNKGWSSMSMVGRLYHVGTIPNTRGNIFAADLRVMVGSSPEGFFPVAIYARRARIPLADTLDAGTSSWDMLGTNLSYKNTDGSWGTETERLLLMDSRDFNKIGVGIDDLIEAYMQTILAVTAIDSLACKLITPKGNFGTKLFQSLNPDPKLLSEICNTVLAPPLGPPMPPLANGLAGPSNMPAEAALDGARHEGAHEPPEEALAAELELRVEKAQPLGKRKRPFLASVSV